MKLGLKHYFTSIKNVFDILGFSCYTIFAILCLYDVDSARYFFIPALVCGLFRGAMTFFNILEGTRYLV